MSRTRQQRGFTLIEILVVLCIISVMAAVLFSVVNQGRKRGYIATCTSNLHQIHLAREMYKQDSDGKIPSELRNLVPNYLNDKRLLVCPNDPFAEMGGWEWVGWQSMGVPPKNGRPPQSYPYILTFDSPLLDKFIESGTMGFALADKERVMQTAGYLTCRLHGDYIGESGTQPDGKDFPTVYKGLTLRLCMDGSVRQFYQPVNGSGGVGFHWDK